MNQEHLKAIFTAIGSYPRIVADCDGTRIVSEGHIATIGDYPLSQDPRMNPQRMKFVGMWRNWQVAEPPEIMPTSTIVRISDNSFARLLDTDVYINEAYYRAFIGEKTSFHYSGKIDAPVLVKEAGSFVGVIMSIRGGSEFSVYASETSELLDKEVFASFASESNGYYLQGDTVLLREIAGLRQEISRLEKKVNEAESELDEAQSELEEKLAVLNTLTVKEQ